MDSFMLADFKKYVNIWDIPVLYGDAADILVSDTDRDLLDERPRQASPPLADWRSGIFAFPREERDSLPVIHVVGSFFEVGFKIGRTFSSMIRDYVLKHRDVALYEKLYETPKGKQVYDSSYDSVSRVYPEYMRELEGIASGAALPFYKLFLLHMEDIMLVALPQGERRPVPSRGSTTIVATDHNHQILGQVIDADQVALSNLYVVKVTITECFPPQEFTALCIGGMLPGNSISFNAQGLVLAVDPVPIRKCNECGVPRSILCRDLLSLHDVVQIGNLLRCEGPGIGNGVAVTCTQAGVQLTMRSFWNYETAPYYPAHSNSCVARQEITPIKTHSYYHMNKFHKLSPIQEVIQNPYANWILSKKNVLKKYEDQFGPKIKQILGENSVHTTELKNIFTSTVTSCGLVSVAVGLFNIMEDTLSIYLDNPAEKSPIIANMPLSSQTNR